MASSNEHDRDDGGFLSRWSRRKQQVRQGAVVAEPPVPVRPAAVPQALAEPAPRSPVATPLPGAAAPAADSESATTLPAAAPAPTLADVAALTAESDYARFVAPGVDRSVKNAALKKLFTDPHFNIMDGLDTYIDDYGQPDPLPEGMLRQMAQSHALGLFADDPPAPPDLAEPLTSALPADSSPAPSAAALPSTPHQPNATPDEDAALRLQPHDAAGPAGPGTGAEPHAGRQP